MIIRWFTKAFLALALAVLSADAATVEVCDKFAESWRRGDPPVVAFPVRGWQLLFHPVFVALLGATVAVGILVWFRIKAAIAAVWTAIIWMTIAISPLVFDLLPLSYDDPVYQAADLEGCAVFEKSGILEFPLSSIAISLAMLILWWHRRVHAVTQASP